MKFHYSKSVLQFLKLNLVLFIVSITGSVNLQAATYYARANANWNQASTWSNISPGGLQGLSVPGSGDVVIIDGYNVGINLTTGSVTVSSLTLRNSSVNNTSYLKVEDGMSLTITNDLQMNGSRSGKDIYLDIIDNNTRVNVGGNLLINQSNGNVIVDVENTAGLNISGSVVGTRTGGDDTNFTLNETLGTGANIKIGGDFKLSIDNFNTVGVLFLLNAASCQFSVAGTFSVSENTAASNTGSVSFSLNGGTMTIGSTLELSRTSLCGTIIFHMYGGHLTANSVSVTSTGPYSLNGAVRFFVDDNSTMNIANDYNATVSGGGYLCLETNVFSGTSATIHIGGNYTINRSGGGEIHIYSDYNNSLIDIDGNLTINSSGGEYTFIRVNSTATMSIGGNFSITHTEGQNVDIYVVGSGSSPHFDIAGSMSVSMLGGADNCNLTVDGGTLSVGTDCFLSNGSGSNNFITAIDGAAQMTVGGNLTYSLTGGNNMTFGLGETTAGSTCKLDVAGHARMIHNYNNAAALMSLKVHNKSELEAGQLTLTQTYTAPALFLADITNTAVVDVDGNLNLNAAGGGELEMRLAGSSTLQLMGNITRAASPNMFGKVNSTATSVIEFNGNTPQIIAQSAGNGGDEVYYRALTLNNTSNTYPQFTMQGSATINNTIKFTDGVVATTSTNILVIPDNVTATSASDVSYVDGPVRKVGNDGFTFPLGDNNNYQAITITAPTATTDAFEGQYYNTDPGTTYDSLQKASGINHVSKCEYWILNRTTGTSNVTVGLTWDSHSCGVTNLADLRVARWSGSQWANQGNGGTTGNTAAGTINTSGNVTSFSPFTLASSQRSSNPLPIELTEFNAIKSGDIVLLDWKTVVEKDCDHFEIERSENAQDWEFVTSKKAVGANSDYTMYDAADSAPFKGIGYYRLKSIDRDGTFEFSKIVAVNDQDGFNFEMYPNPAEGPCLLQGAGISNASVKLTDALGQVIGVIKHVEGENKISLDVSTLREGVYFLEVSKCSFVKTEKLLIHHSN
jgi:hypothetical protein